MFSASCSHVFLFLRCRLSILNAFSRTQIAFSAADLNPKPANRNLKSTDPTPCPNACVILLRADLPGGGNFGATLGLSGGADVHISSSGPSSGDDTLL
jgi:hypothetical protein